MAAVASATPYDTSGSFASSNANLPASDFSGALSIWKEINLSELQSQLISLAPGVLEAQRVAVTNRKQLADHTREFKKQPDENKLESFKPLLKAYQTEIDTLTKRAKAAENAFLNVHSALSTAPDPYPFLEVILEQAAALNDLDNIKQQNALLIDQVAALQQTATQREADTSDKQQLQLRLSQLEQSFETKIRDREADMEKELSAKWDERLRNLNEREKDLTKSLNLAHEQLRELKSKEETTTAQLLEKGNQDDEREVKGKLAEMELLTRDLERAQTRIESVERRNEQLRAEIESVRSGRQENEKLGRLETEAQEKDRKILQLQSLVDKERQARENADRSTQKLQIDKAKLQKERETEVDALRSKLQQRSDYDEIKRELEIVKMVHFSADDDADTDSPDANGSHDPAAAKPLEALLLEKNKRLEDQLATLRVANEELATNSKSTGSELAKLRKDIARLRSLNEKLENDLVSVGGEGNTARGAATMSAEDALKEMNLLEEEATRSERLKGGAANASRKDSSNGAAKLSPALSASRVSTSSSMAPAAGGDSSILPIITSQRDRFRSRNAELEEELRKRFETISELRTEVKTLQTDNVSLYEKVRYLQSYGPGSGRRVDGEAVIHMGSKVAVGRTDASGAYPPPRVGEDKYRAKYEESMNPFEAFRGREQTRAMAQLNPLERVLHLLARLVLNHRRMRLFLMAYAILLHFMVFGMVFEVSTTSSVQTVGCALRDAPDQPIPHL